MYKLRKNPILRTLSRLVAYYGVCAFIVTSVFLPTQSYAQSSLGLPAPGTMISTSPVFNPVIVHGITLYPDNPLKFDFIIDKGDTELEGEAFQKEASKLIKYFMASLTIPEEEMWVNLSPYEKNRIIPQYFGDTLMGRDLLAQDYMLKQLSASLMYPESELGKEFWERVYKQAQDKFGTTEIPVDTFNKIWIVPERAKIYEHAKGAFIVKTHLKVLLEEDYLALEANAGSTKHGLGDVGLNDVEVISGTSSKIIREILIPEIEREVNERQTFANLRQIYNSMILAAWYKKALKQSVLSQVYVDKGRTQGIDVEDKTVNERIYNQYIQAFEKGVYNFIKEDYDPVTQQIIPRKYFSGGVSFDSAKLSSSPIEEGGINEDELRKAIETLKKAISVTAGFKGVIGGPSEETAPISPELVELQEEIDSAFERFSPATFTKLQATGIPFHRIAVELLVEYIFMQDELQACIKIVNELLSPVFWGGYDNKEEIIEALREVLTLANSDGVDGFSFARSLAKARAHIDLKSIKAESVVAMKNFPDTLLPNRPYLDLAAGPNFATFMPGFNQQTQYVAVDSSYFVVEYLNEVKHLLGLENVEVIQQDVRELARPSEPVGAIRVKNVWSYVEGFGTKMREMTDWLDEGGQLIIQTDAVMAQRKGALEIMEDLAKELIAQGWEFDFEFGNRSEFKMDRIVLTRRTADVPSTVGKTWEQYLGEYVGLLSEEVSGMLAGRLGRTKPLSPFGIEPITSIITPSPFDDGGISFKSILDKIEMPEIKIPDFKIEPLQINLSGATQYEDVELDEDSATKYFDDVVAFNKDGKRYFLADRPVVSELGSGERELTEAERQEVQDVLTKFLENEPDSPFRPKVEQKLEDLASSPVGGIDFNPQILDLEIEYSNERLSMPLIPQQTIQNINIQGFTPVIINVAPITNLLLILGESEEQSDEFSLSQLN